MKTDVVLAVLIAAFGVSGCNSTQGAYYNMDGSIIAGDAQAQKFDADRSICLGEMGKAKLGSSPTETGNPFIDASNDLDRQRSADQVMIGCMASKGYRYTVKSS